MDRPEDTEPLPAGALNGGRDAVPCGPQALVRQGIVDWLLEERLRRTRPTLVFDQLCRRLRDAGVPVDRATFHSPQLDPQIRTSGLFWHFEAGGAQTLHRGHGIENSQLYQSSPIFRIFNGGPPVRARIQPGKGKLQYPILEDLRRQGFRDYTLRPLPFSTGRINAVGFSTKEAAGFQDWQIALIDAVLPALGAVLETRHLLRTARGLLDAYVGPRSTQRILSGTIKRGDVEEINAVLWYCDLREFTALSEALTAKEMVVLLDAYFDCVTAPIQARGGEILKFIGDAVLAIFPISEGNPAGQACCAAVEAAREAVANLAELSAQRVAAGEAALHCGVALHRGDVMYGNIGAPGRLDFTVIGPAVNLVTRIEDLTRDRDPPIVFSREVATCCGRPTLSLGAFPLKGITGEAEVFTLHPLQQEAFFPCKSG